MSIFCCCSDSPTFETERLITNKHEQKNSGNRGVMMMPDPEIGRLSGLLDKVLGQLATSNEMFLSISTTYGENAAGNNSSDAVVELPPSYSSLKSDLAQAKASLGTSKSTDVSAELVERIGTTFTSFGQTIPPLIAKKEEALLAAQRTQKTFTNEIDALKNKTTALSSILGKLSAANEIFHQIVNTYEEQSHAESLIAQYSSLKTDIAKAQGLLTQSNPEGTKELFEKIDKEFTSFNEQVSLVVGKKQESLLSQLEAIDINQDHDDDDDDDVVKQANTSSFSRASHLTSTTNRSSTTTKSTNLFSGVSHGTLTNLLSEFHTVLDETKPKPAPSQNILYATSEQDLTLQI